MSHGLRRRLLLGFVGVALVTGVVASAATIIGFLVVANQHPIGANRVGRHLVGWLPSSPSTRAIEIAFVTIGLLLGSLAVGTAQSIAQRLLRPVGELADAADRMAAGDLRVRLDPEGD